MAPFPVLSVPFPLRLQHAVPAITLGILETDSPVSGPLPVEHRSGILPMETGCHGLFEHPATTSGVTYSRGKSETSNRRSCEPAGWTAHRSPDRTFDVDNSA
jgi:hypothetical protein